MDYKLIRIMNKLLFRAKNSFLSVGKPMLLDVEGLYTLRTEVSYESKYPNGFLDLYVGNGELGGNVTSRPTIIFLHGGGFVWGDKSEYMPCDKKPGKDWYFRNFLKAGYNIVCVNYAFAPEYIYPTPVLQLDEAVRFLLKKGEAYGIFMKQIVLAGNSAGANIAGQYTNIQTNSDYAKELGIEPVLKQGQLAAFLSNSGLLDNERFGKTGMKAVDNLFSKCGNTYFNCAELHGNPAAIQSNVISHATRDFPPAFLSDGNSGTFTMQAKDMATRLETLGVPCRLNLYDISVQKLGHDFERKNDHYSQENIRAMLEFLISL